MAVSDVTRTHLKVVCGKFSQFAFEHHDVLGAVLWTMVANGCIGSLWYPTTIVSVMNYTAMLGDMFLDHDHTA